MKTAKGQINISIDIGCPYCNCYIDLFDQNLFQGLHDDGYIQRKIFDEKGWGCDDLDEVITCPECKNELRIGEISW